MFDMERGGNLEKAPSSFFQVLFVVKLQQRPMQLFITITFIQCTCDNISSNRQTSINLMAVMTFTDVE